MSYDSAKRQPDFLSVLTCIHLPPFPLSGEHLEITNTQQ